mmetsp:Transcript_9142/g.13518  ORF Transcript_9142/g.13518 Transcript_9142/m.13518 type:complete len:166 (+) Transcript_9142:60-557(+)|eukprot:CAMPEP_0117418840 /NCGR_PEP_ID=MMETSP0758-20121206/543_1 /TAXON_ID=63605 /ORGANISM="Percolomonas cosmopolitus, Strain AE-1 (ATCC 50343)" /LENGTH=165 /DNA_ID=CAMNT_0005199589 /DNA_START=52 /DNA_END=546 /DNA_ORIENTATION=+
MVVKTLLCAFSGYNIYPGRGKQYVPTTSVQQTRPVFFFSSKKAFSHFERRRKPRVIRWTRVYRRLHRKGTDQRAKRSRRVRSKAQKVITRGFKGASSEFITSRRGQTSDARVSIRKDQRKRDEEARKARRDAKKKAAKAQSKADKQQQRVQQRVPKNVRRALKKF